MTAARVIMSGSIGRGGVVVLSDLGTGRLRVCAREHMGPGDLRVDLDADAGETPVELRGRAERQLAEQRLIAETLAQPWPRLDGETPDPAHHWQAAGFDDAGIVAWLEVGVFGSASAQQLRDAGITPREVGRQHEPDTTLGLAFARGELTREQLLAEVDR
jgi:hypothetical protein